MCTCGNFISVGPGRLWLAKRYHIRAIRLQRPLRYPSRRNRQLILGLFKRFVILENSFLDPTTLSFPSTVPDNGLQTSILSYSAIMGTIEISKKVLRREDGAFTRASGGYQYFGHLEPYIIITQHAYGRMDASTPAPGLATDTLASCIAIVFHCPTTGRTILTHSTNFLNMNTFLPIIDWVTGGNGEVDGDKRSEVQRWLWSAIQNTTAKSCVMEAVVLRGFLYETPLMSKSVHEEWMDNFKNFLSKTALLRSIQLNIVDFPQPLSNGAVLVDKTTAHITCVELHKSIQPHTPLSVRLHNPGISESESYSDAQQNQDQFVGLYLNRRTPREPTPISLQYDIVRYCLPHPLPDEARQLVRSKKEGEPSAQQSAIIKAFGLSEDWISKPSAHALIHTMFNRLVSGPPCERCGRLGLRKCSVCKGAWYCGERHQREDWKSHKGWCKSHPFPPKSNQK